MSAHRPIQQLPPRMTPPWTKPEPLPDKPGGETNLLHRSAWADPADPLRVEFKPWYDDPPPPGTERVDVFLDDDESNIIGTRTWTLPMDPADYYVEITADKLPQGEHQISYIMTNLGGVADRSFPYTVTIDKQEPLLNISSELKFPAEVLPPNKLTDQYLRSNGDQVKADLPAYESPRPWDRITWYWQPTLGTPVIGGVIELDDTNYANPVILTVPGSFIRDKRDGRRFVRYEIHDRAGNLSRPSEFIELDVSATPIPRTLPPVAVEKASGGTSSGTLKPIDGVGGVTVTIPSVAVIHDGEGVFVQWGTPNSVGAYRTDTPISPGSRAYKIPERSIAPHVGKTLPVYYEVFEPGVIQPHKSNNYTLRVDQLIGLPTIQCDKISGNKLSLASLISGYADFTLESWTFMSTDQFLTVTVEGVSNGQKLVIDVLTDSPVPEVTQKISAGRISKVNLQRFTLNYALDVKVKVSFDNKQTWKAFPTLTPTLVA